MSDDAQTWITYVDYDVGDEPYYFAYEGEYAPEHSLDPIYSAGTRFEMDGIEFEICGDLNGHVIYRRVNGDDALYSMSWRELSDNCSEGIIEIKGAC